MGSTGCHVGAAIHGTVEKCVAAAMLPLTGLPAPAYCVLLRQVEGQRDDGCVKMLHSVRFGFRARPLKGKLGHFTTHRNQAVRALWVLPSVAEAMLRGEVSLPGFESKKCAHLFFTTVGPWVVEHSSIVPGKTVHNAGVNGQESVFLMAKQKITSGKRAVPLNEALLCLTGTATNRGQMHEWLSRFLETQRPQNFPQLRSVADGASAPPLVQVGGDDEVQLGPSNVYRSFWGRGGIPALANSPEADALRRAYRTHKTFHGKGGKVR
jgi:hypothetical protein